MRLISRKPIIYNALCSLYERRIVSRGLVSRFSPKAFWYWFVDWFAVRCADMVMLETDHQIAYFKKLFGGNLKKYFRAWTGVDDTKFPYDPEYPKHNEFTVLFRGALMPEAGAEYIVQAAKLLEDIPVRILMLSNGLLASKIKALIQDLRPKNLTWIQEFLPDAELLKTMREAHVSLGQLSDHDRLTRTIPHKAYESLALGLPYLTAANPAILELLTPSETCLICKPADAESLALQIRWAYEHQQELKEIGRRGRELYASELTPKILAQKVIRNLQ